MLLELTYLLIGSGKLPMLDALGLVTLLNAPADNCFFPRLSFKCCIYSLLAKLLEQLTLTQLVAKKSEESKKPFPNDPWVSRK